MNSTPVTSSETRPEQTTPAAPCAATPAVPDANPLPPGCEAFDLDDLEVVESKVFA
jgi:hypothetical protein